MKFEWILYFENTPGISYNGNVDFKLEDMSFPNLNVKIGDPFVANILFNLGGNLISRCLAYCKTLIGVTNVATELFGALIHISKKVVVSTGIGFLQAKYSPIFTIDSVSHSKMQDFVAS
jgi:hypothetical protein